jgi:hypothetical protein
MMFDPQDGTPPSEEEETDPDASSDPEPEGSAPERVRTGSDRVDEVIRAVEELDERPVEEHVAVFESAQARLRRALDEPDDADDADDADAVEPPEDAFGDAAGHDLDDSDHP